MDNMCCDNIERPVCSAHRPVIYTQLGTHHSNLVGLFNTQATVWGPCGRYLSTCIVNVASLTITKPPLKYHYCVSVPILTKGSNCCEGVDLLEKGTIIYDLRLIPVNNDMLYLSCSLCDKCYGSTVTEMMLIRSVSDVTNGCSS